MLHNTAATLPGIKGLFFCLADCTKSIQASLKCDLWTFAVAFFFLFINVSCTQTREEITPLCPPPIIDHMVIISASLEHCRLFVCLFFYRLKAPHSVKPHSLPLSAASQARTNHCHWALSDRTDARRWGEITKTRVGVAFGLFFSGRKEQKNLILM